VAGALGTQRQPAAQPLPGAQGHVGLCSQRRHLRPLRGQLGRQLPPGRQVQAFLVVPQPARQRAVGHQDDRKRHWPIHPDGPSDVGSPVLVIQAHPLAHRVQRSLDLPAHLRQHGVQVQRLRQLVAKVLERLPVIHRFAEKYPVHQLLKPVPQRVEEQRQRQDEERERDRVAGLDREKVAQAVDEDGIGRDDKEGQRPVGHAPAEKPVDVEQPVAQDGVRDGEREKGEQWGVHRREEGHRAAQGVEQQPGDDRQEGQRPAQEHDAALLPDQR